MNDNHIKWDNRFLALAKEVASWSKDPSTQVGSVIVNADNIVIGLGYNGFPRGVEDFPERLADRDLKLAYTIHAEMNAILNATQSVKGATIYTWPFMPCDRCAAHIVQAGISRIIAPSDRSERSLRWLPTFERSAALYREAFVDVFIYHDATTFVDMDYELDCLRNMLPRDTVSAAV